MRLQAGMRPERDHWGLLVRMTNIGGAEKAAYFAYPRCSWDSSWREFPCDAFGVAGSAGFLKTALSLSQQGIARIAIASERGKFGAPFAEPRLECRCAGAFYDVCDLDEQGFDFVVHRRAMEAHPRPSESAYRDRFESRP